MADWKTDLKKAYDESANEKVKESDAAYKKKSAQVLGDALSRGLGRSSYLTATQANLMDDMNEAGNQIRTDFRLEYLKMLQQREMEEAQLAEQRREFDLRYGGLGDGGYGGGYGGRGGNGGTTLDTQGNPVTDNTSWMNALYDWRAQSAADANRAALYSTGGEKSTFRPTDLASRGIGQRRTALTR